MNGQPLYQRPDGVNLALSQIRTVTLETYGIGITKELPGAPLMSKRSEFALYRERVDRGPDDVVTGIQEVAYRGTIGSANNVTAKITPSTKYPELLELTVSGFNAKDHREVETLIKMLDDRRYFSLKNI